MARELCRGTRRYKLSLLGPATWDAELSLPLLRPASIWNDAEWRVISQSAASRLFYFFIIIFFFRITGSLIKFLLKNYTCVCADVRFCLILFYLAHTDRKNFFFLTCKCKISVDVQDTQLHVKSAHFNDIIHINFVARIFSSYINMTLKG